mgnify:CR=1 FL=1
MSFSILNSCSCYNINLATLSASLSTDFPSSEYNSLISPIILSSLSTLLVLDVYLPDFSSFSGSSPSKFRDFINETFYKIASILSNNTSSNS